MKTEAIESKPALQQLVSAIQDLSLAKDIESVMQIVRKVARKITGADGATFILREGTLCYYADEDAISPLWKGQRFQMSECISGWVMLNKQPALIEDIYVDSRIPVDAYKPTFVKSLAMVPIRTKEPIGAIGNYWAKKHLPTQSELEMLQALADITSVSIENLHILASLEEKVKQRTQELEFLNKELESFSYSVSHDLRAPLRAITGYIKMLEEDYATVLDYDAKQLIQKTVTNAEKMNQLIDALLQLSRMGRKEIVKSVIDMKRMAEIVYHNLTENDKQRQIDFSIEELPPIEADETLIRQVWINYISNAIKYSGRKPITKIHIGFQKSEDRTIYYVKDNGTGFDMKYVSKLFGVFQRLHSEQEFEGTGIGLSIVQKIVQKHGGTTWAEGKPNEGACFYFSLPKNNLQTSTH